MEAGAGSMLCGERLPMWDRSRLGAAGCRRRVQRVEGEDRECGRRGLSAATAQAANVTVCYHVLLRTHDKRRDHLGIRLVWIVGWPVNSVARYTEPLNVTVVPGGVAYVAFAHLYWLLAVAIAVAITGLLWGTHPWRVILTEATAEIQFLPLGAIRQTVRREDVQLRSGRWAISFHISDEHRHLLFRRCIMRTGGFPMTRFEREARRLKYDVQGT